MTDHAKVLEQMAMNYADAIEECERLRAENARLRELALDMRERLSDCDAARAWDEEVGK